MGVSLFLRRSVSEIKNLVQQTKLSHINVTEKQIDFLGYQLLQYLLGLVEGGCFIPINGIITRSNFAD